MNGLCASGSWFLAALVAMVLPGCVNGSAGSPAATTAMTSPMVMDDATTLPTQTGARGAGAPVNDEASVAGHPEQRWGRPDRSK